MKALIRTKGSGRPKNRDDSDIPSIIDELNEDEKKRNYRKLNQRTKR